MANLGGGTSEKCKRANGLCSYVDEGRGDNEMCLLNFHQIYVVEKSREDEPLFTARLC